MVHMGSLGHRSFSMEKGPTTLGYQLAQLADDSSKWHTAKHTAHREGGTGWDQGLLGLVGWIKGAKRACAWHKKSPESRGYSRG